jgi:hypothetical protein
MSVSKADAILAHYPISGDRKILGISPEQGAELVRAGLAYEYDPGYFKATRSGRKRKAALMDSSPGGRIYGVGGGGSIHLGGGRAIINS